MNNSRVNFKHHGSIPSATDLEQFRADVTTFFTDATQVVFAADFASLDMIDLVTQQEALNRLHAAEAHAAQGDYTEALALLSETFDGLLDDYARRKVNANGSSAYTWLAPQGILGPPTVPKHGPEMAERMEYIYRSLDEMQRAMRVLAMGLDYRRYARFKLLVPSIYRFMDMHREVRPVVGLQVGADEYKFCKQFVIEAALHLAEMDFDLDILGLFWEHVDRESDQRAGRTQPDT